MPTGFATNSNTGAQVASAGVGKMLTWCEPEYITVLTTSNQTVSAGEIFDWNTVGTSNILTLSTNAIQTLTAGGVYYLTAKVAFSTVGTSTGYCQPAWYSTASTILNSNIKGVIGAPTSTLSPTNNAAISMIFKPSVNTGVYLIMNSITPSGTPTTDAAKCFASVYRLF